MTSPHRQSGPAHLAERIRGMLMGAPVSEKRMFGGITFLHHGNMLCCASGKGLMVRVGRDAEPRALARPGASQCTGTGRPMTGFIMVEPEGVSADEELARWLDMALAYVGTLPAKQEKPLTRPPRRTRGKT